MRLYRSRLTCKPKTKSCNAWLLGAMTDWAATGERET
jgi:hypothetical protein